MRISVNERRRYVLSMPTRQQRRIPPAAMVFTVMACSAQKRYKTSAWARLSIRIWMQMVGP